MARRCDRPGCSELAAVAFGFDAGRLLVWLDALVDDDRARAGALCKRHAERLTVPNGWWLDDRRVVVPELFRAGPGTSSEPPPPPPGPAAPAARRGSRRRPRKPAPEAPPPNQSAELPPPGPPENLVAFSGFDDAGSPAVKPTVKLPLPPPVIPAAPGAPVAAVRAVATAGPLPAPLADEPEPVDPVFEPSTPLLARAFTGAARPDRPHHRTRHNPSNGTNGTNGTNSSNGVDPVL